VTSRIRQPRPWRRRRRVAHAPAAADQPYSRLPWRCPREERDRGAVTLELVLSLPVWVALLLFVILCGRLVTAQLDVDAAAHNAARAASLARSNPAAVRDARTAAEQALTDRKITCRDLTVSVDTGGLRPGTPVQVDVSCTASLSDLGLLGVPGTRTVTATSTSPVDTWRGQ
jgi:Flp pilus assembly protein TadG